ncbi:MAG TPA: hypothetical protein VNO75_12320 [Gemmatimonadaceae bacterium]|nr:hypothetical protein [Gemmatimonadaceae bacterium]
MITRVLALGVVIFCAAASTAEAQRRCTKGIPCGNSCISATKTCRIGTAAERPPAETPATDPYRPARAKQPDSAQAAFLRALRGEADPRVLIDAGPWLGSVDGNIYYLSSCTTAATKLAFDERVYFKTEEEAVSKGYRRSRAKGC